LADKHCRSIYHISDIDIDEDSSLIWVHKFGIKPIPLQGSPARATRGCGTGFSLLSMRQFFLQDCPVKDVPASACEQLSSLSTPLHHLKLPSSAFSTRFLQFLRDMSGIGEPYSRFKAIFSMKGLQDEAEV
jgi:hypothetical protein